MNPIWPGAAKRGVKANPWVGRRKSGLARMSEFSVMMANVLAVVAGVSLMTQPSNCNSPMWQGLPA